MIEQCLHNDVELYDYDSTGLGIYECQECGAQLWDDDMQP